MTSSISRGICSGVAELMLMLMLMLMLLLLLFLMFMLIPMLTHTHKHRQTHTHTQTGVVHTVIWLPIVCLRWVPSMSCWMSPPLSKHQSQERWVRCVCVCFDSSVFFPIFRWCFELSMLFRFFRVFFEFAEFSVILQRFGNFSNVRCVFEMSVYFSICLRFFEFRCCFDFSAVSACLVRQKCPVYC